jgi:hypothetical protein
MEKIPNPVIFEALQAETMRDGARYILTAIKTATHDTSPLITHDQVIKFLEVMNSHFDDIGDKAKAMFEVGLTDIGRAPYMDDDDYEPRQPADSVEEALIQKGALEILLTFGLSQEHCSFVADRTVEPFLNAFQALFAGQFQGTYMAMRGLKRIGLAPYVED